MMSDVFFFDTYAIIEILKGSKAYDKYVDCTALITKLNIFEIYTSVLREFGVEKAENVLEKWYPSVIDYDEEIIKDAGRLWFKMRKQKVSMTDCIGYVLAAYWKVPFLTGDKEFEDLEGVEYIK